MAAQNGTVTVEHLANVSEADLQEISDAVRSLGGVPALKSVEPGFQNAADWALPALAALFMAKPFTDAFLKQLGKDSAVVFGKATSALFRAVKGKNVEWHRKSSPIPRKSPLLKLQFELSDAGEIAPPH